MLAGREDRGLDCLENLDHGVEGATDHGWLEAADPKYSLSVAHGASRSVLVWRTMSPVGLGRETQTLWLRLVPLQTFAGRVRDESAANTLHWEEGCGSSVAQPVVVIVVVMVVGQTRRCEEPWIGEGAAGVDRWDVQPRDPKRCLEGLAACVEGTNHQDDGHGLC